jgi:hypothetical protein
MSKMRSWGTATRDTDEGKIDFEGILNPLALKAFGEYMEKHRHTANGLRDSDNWQGFFGDEHIKVCTKSLIRHTHDVWMENRGYKSREGIDDALGGVIFNAFAIWLKILTERENETKTKTHKKS